MSFPPSMIMRSVRAGSIAISRRTFVSASPRLNLKESSSQSDVDYNHHKQDSLSKQKRGAGHWKPELASDSEEIVHADRAARDGVPEDISALRERTKRAAEEASKGGTSMRDSMAPPFQSALLAGALAGTTVDLSLFPLDTLKTRLQSSAGFFPSGGFSGIYRGIGSAVVGSAPGAAFFFCTYESVKALLASRIRQRQGENAGPPPAWQGPVSHMIAASAGEVAACAIRVPTEVVKQRAQAGHHGGSSAAALRAILSKYGTHGLVSVWRELYRGWGITVFREVPFTVIQFPLWEAMKAWGRKRRGGEEVSAGESGLYGSMAGGVAAALTTPLDVLKTRVMLSKERVSVAEVFGRLVREQGIRPFFAGIVPRVTWISIGGAIFLGSYQWAINTMHGRVW
ncbi:mitochondrial carrier protein PET8 [Mariannaea sp. PMI_226]|nr:mitochondrial carrier protein PET8 [Mariannaea sp. PMI_226]